jgi:hypothetical protein
VTTASRGYCVSEDTTFRVQLSSRQFRGRLRKSLCSRATLLMQAGPTAKAASSLKPIREPEEPLHPPNLGVRQPLAPQVTSFTKDQNHSASTPDGHSASCRACSEFSRTTLGCPASNLEVARAGNGQSFGQRTASSRAAGPHRSNRWTGQQGERKGGASGSRKLEKARRGRL